MRSEGAAVVEFGPQQVPDFDLRDVVYDEFVVQQRTTHFLGVLARAHRNGYVVHFDEVGGVGSGAADSLGGLFARGKEGSVGVGLILLVHVSEGDFAEQEDAGAVFAGGEAVVGGLGGHVGEVDALAEHVAGNWGFGWSNSQSLAEDAHEVGQSAPVPQQHLVVDVLGKAHVFSFVIEGEEVLQVEGVGGVGGTVGALQVAVDDIELLGGLINGADLSVEPQVVGVDLVFVFAAAADDAGGQFDFGEGFQHFQFLLDFDLIVKDEVAHVGEAEIVGDVGIEVVGELVHNFHPALALDFLHEFLQDLVSAQDGILGEVSQRHLVDVVADLDHLLVHHFQIEDQLDQPFYWVGQFALVEFFIFILLLWPFGSAVLLVFGVSIVEFYFSVVAVVVFVVVFGVVQADGVGDGVGSQVGLLSLHPHATPTRVEVAMIAVAVALQNLQNVVFIVIVLD